MKNFIIYHNPRCSKSREALEILKQNAVNITIIEYLKNPLNFEQLKTLSSHFVFSDFVRKNEPSFKALGLSMDEQDSILRAMEQEPKIMQRPIVILGERAVIARPPERVLALI